MYELLTGSTPIEKARLRTSGLDEVLRIIREEDPPRPSDRVSTLEAEMLSTISDQHQVNPGKLAFSLKGELDWIVMRAMAKQAEAHGFRIEGINLEVTGLCADCAAAA